MINGKRIFLFVFLCVTRTVQPVESIYNVCVRRDYSLDFKNYLRIFNFNGVFLIKYFFVFCFRSKNYVLSKFTLLCNAHTRSS